MASRRPVLLNHPESLCPVRLPRASRGLCRGAFRDPCRNVVLLTPSISLRLIQALSYTQVTRETPRIPVFAFNSLRTLSFSVSYKSCVCHSYANGRGVYQQFPTWNEFLVTCNRIQVLYFHILPDSFALSQSPTLFFSCGSTLFAQNTRGGGMASSGIPKEELELFLHLKRDQRFAQRSGTRVPPGNLARSHSSPQLLVVSLPFTSGSPDRTARRSALPAWCRSWARLRLSSTRTPSRSFPRPFC